MPKTPKVKQIITKEDLLSPEDFKDIQELAVLPLVLLRRFPEYNECSFCSLHDSKSEFYYKKYCKNSPLSCTQKRYNYHKDAAISRNTVLRKIYGF